MHTQRVMKSTTPFSSTTLLTAEPLFESRTIVELSDLEMMEIDGGTTPVCAAAVASSGGCVAVGSFIAGTVLGYFAQQRAVAH